jgi:hypothetical protein
MTAEAMPCSGKRPTTPAAATPGVWGSPGIRCPVALPKDGTNCQGYQKRIFTNLPLLPVFMGDGHQNGQGPERDIAGEPSRSFPAAFILNGRIRVRLKKICSGEFNGKL